MATNNDAEVLKKLTVAELRQLCRGRLRLSRDAHSSKENLIAAILRSDLEYLIVEARDLVIQKENACIQKKQRKRKAIQTPSPEQLESRKRKRNDRVHARRVAQRVDTLEGGSWRAQHDTSQFMDLPSGDKVKECYRAFYDATSATALRLCVCGVCAREVNWTEDNVKSIPLNELPNGHRLIPNRPHPAHDLFDNKLLEPAGVQSEGKQINVNVCGTCLADLSKKTSSKSDDTKPPKFSLANNLWIGKVPWILQMLTFPEQLLIALLYPRVYVFKLYPKGAGPRDPQTLQRGMRGTVSTFELDTHGISSMISGNLMPRPPAVLATLISVTFIGLGDLPKRWIKSTFRVRRCIVFEALQWLKEHNSKYYGDIDIDSSRIAALPEDDVPLELMSIIRQCEDTGIVDQESAGYVPQDSDDNQTTFDEPDDIASMAIDDSDEFKDDTIEEDITRPSHDDPPAVFPLEITGTVDTDLSKMSANEMMLWALANLWKEGQEGGYIVRHGAKPVRDFGQPLHGEDKDPDRPNLFEKAFPCLFPYGRGGIESDRETVIDFIDHVRWALQYHDRRFRKHETFPFLAFGIYQRRQALASARVTIRSRNFEKDAHLLAAITAEKLQQAEREESQGLPISDPAVCTLRKHVHATIGRVMGSNQSRYQLRSQIWSTSVLLGPVTLWVTINPSDINDPIAQIFAGEKIDLDHFLASLGPDKDQRARNIAADPYAAAKFFNFLITTILETLFGVKTTNFQVKSEDGIFGRVAAYFGVVESQGRGTLHLHLLVWLKNAPNPDQMMELLKSEEFRAKILAYIRANLRAYLPGLESADSIKAIPREPEIAYNRPPNPDSPNYEDKLREFELRVARTEQLHTCKLRRCLVLDKSGRYRCKRRAPFPCSDDDFVKENGEWGQKRLYGYINGWIPGILINGRCNNDGKLLTNGRDTRNVTFYATVYASKKQNRNENMSAIMAKGYAYHLDQLSTGASLQYLDGLRDDHRLLLFRIANTINHEQELAAPMVMSYLMGWGDTYRSHHYSPIYWSSFVKALVKIFPGLRKPHESRASVPSSQTLLQELISSSETDVGQAAVHENESMDDVANLDLDSSGKLFMKSQVTDYCLRGAELENMNIIEFFVDTYEEDIPRIKRQSQRSCQADISDSEEEKDDSVRRPGRKRNQRIPYLSQHPKFHHVHRVRRSYGHNNLPNFLGRHFPRRDDPEMADFYYASMLMLLKPWRSLETDLKNEGQTWEEAFQQMISSPIADEKRMKDILAGIQYFHECASLALDNEEPASHSLQFDLRQHHEAVSAPWEDDVACEGEVDEDDDITEEKLENVIAAQTPLNEELHAQFAVELAKRVHIFPNDNTIWQVSSQDHVANATGDDWLRLTRWREQMEADVIRQNSLDAEVACEVAETLVAPMKTENLPSVIIEPNATSEAALEPLDVSQLRPDQRRAYDIIIWHLDETLAGRNPPPLRMILQGEGGTGKSKVIQTVTEAFKKRGVQDMLIKTAYTGVAASLIDGKTTHVIGGISVGHEERTLSAEARLKLEIFWRKYHYMILDEYSMPPKDFFALLSRNISIAKQGSRTDGLGGMSFGGINVVICGDFHQFPPVARPIRDALFYPTDPEHDSIDAQLGRAIYEEFTTVVTLKEQMRVTDPVWHDFLRHLRHGQVKEHHLQMLRQLIIGNSEDYNVDFSKEPWNAAALVTPRHAVRKKWNDLAVRKMCQETGRQLFICPAQDTIQPQNRPLTLQERFCLETRFSSQSGSRRRRRQKDLPRVLELAVGMQVMVTNNIETDLDITNGARGEIVGIVLDPDEHPIGNGPIVHLQKMPAYILVKLTRTRATKLEGLDDNVIPIEPTSTTYRIKVPKKVHGQVITQQKTVRRRQFPMTAAYAFTDYRAQGQTLPYVIIDIASPPNGKLTLFNLYVALLRSTGRSTIRLLRDFDDRIFMESHHPALTSEDERLEKLNSITKDWYERTISRK